MRLSCYQETKSASVSVSRVVAESTCGCMHHSPARVQLSQHFLSTLCTQQNQCRGEYAWCKTDKLPGNTRKMLEKVVKPTQRSDRCMCGYTNTAHPHPCTHTTTHTHMEDGKTPSSSTKDAQQQELPPSTVDGAERRTKSVNSYIEHPSGYGPVCWVG